MPKLEFDSTVFWTAFRAVRAVVTDGRLLVARDGRVVLVVERSVAVRAVWVLDWVAARVALRGDVGRDTVARDVFPRAVVPFSDWGFARETTVWVGVFARFIEFASRTAPSAVPMLAKKSAVKSQFPFIPYIIMSILSKLPPKGQGVFRKS